MKFLSAYDQYRRAFDAALKEYCAGLSARPAVLAESMRYSLLSGGKRVRPVLFYAALDMFGIPYESESALALALESVHTYSLIHDDLPAMDNDDYRRGNLSNHKVFGEANAILAGDALLSEACGILLRESARSSRHLAAATTLIEGAGIRGMIAGQSADLLFEKQAGDRDDLFYIYRNKTGKLISAPLVMAAQLADRSVETMQKLGEKLGILFQLTDDILDVKGESRLLGKTAGKDERENKLTCVRLFGLDGALRLADEYRDACQSLIKELPDRGFFSSFVQFVRERDN